MLYELTRLYELSRNAKNPFRISRGLGRESLAALYFIIMVFQSRPRLNLERLFDIYELNRPGEGQHMLMRMFRLEHLEIAWRYLIEHGLIKPIETPELEAVGVAETEQDNG